MPFMLRCADFGRAARASTALVAITVVLLMTCFAASPSLHQHLHRNGNSPDHFCAIFAFAKETLSGTARISVVKTTEVLAANNLRAEPPLTSLFDYFFSPGRAPPRR
jgi:hypothetical protein